MKTKTKQLYPAILTSSLEEAEQQIAIAQELSEVSVVQIDVIDGFFADNFTLTPDDLVLTEFGDLQLDFHLMVNEPVDFVLEAVLFKDDLPIRTMIAQVERMGSQAEYLEAVKRNRWQTGLALDLHTPLEAIDESSWKELNVLQIMGNQAGLQGLSFVPLVLEKIAEAEAFIRQQQLEIEIIVDIGVKLTTAPAILAAGATGLAVGSELWQAGDPHAIVDEYQKLFGTE